MLNPDLWHPYRGGEKPMDLAYLTAVMRSTTLPPYDPWFAGGYINYYYLGQFFTATVGKLTGIVPEVAFNLAVPTFFSLTVAGAFSVSYNLAATARGMLKRRPNGRPIPLWSAAAAGVLGALLVAVVGNLDSVGEMVDRLSAISSWHVASQIPLVSPVANSLGGLWQVVFHGAHFKQPFDYWRPSRMMPPTISITEFPYFSFLFADLHAHMMAIPFDVLAIGASAGVALTRKRERGAWREWLLVALLGLIVGGLRWENSWDYPPFLLLGVAAIVIGERDAEGGFGRAGVRLMAKAALLVFVSFAAYYPFLHNYTSPVSGTHRTLETTPLHQYLAHFGVFLAAVGAWLLWQFARSFRQSDLARLARAGRHGAWREYDGMNVTRQLSISFTVICVAMVGLLALILVSRDRATIAAMVIALSVVAYLGVRELLRPKADSGVKLFVLAMLGLAFGLSLGVDLVTINGDIARMNTVFKFYLHIWLLLGLSSSFAIWYLVFVVWQPSLKAAGSRLPKIAPRYVVGGLLTALLALRGDLPHRGHARAAGRTLREPAANARRRGLHAGHRLQRREGPDQPRRGLRRHPLAATQREGHPRDHGGILAAAVPLGQPLLDLHRHAGRDGLGLASEAAARRVWRTGHRPARPASAKVLRRPRPPPGDNDSERVQRQVRRGGPGREALLQQRRHGEVRERPGRHPGGRIPE